MIIALILTVLSLFAGMTFFVKWRLAGGESDKKRGYGVSAILFGSLAAVCLLMVLFLPSGKGNCKHEYTMVDVYGATCDESGYKEYRCANCGDKYTETSAPLGHNMVFGECSRCGYGREDKETQTDEEKDDLYAAMECASTWLLLGMDPSYSLRDNLSKVTEKDGSYIILGAATKLGESENHIVVIYIELVDKIEKSDNVGFATIGDEMVFGHVYYAEIDDVVVVDESRFSSATESQGSTNEPESEPTEADYCADCVEVNYKNLLRYPDRYVGTKVKVTVRVSQILKTGSYSWSDKAWRAYSDESGRGTYYGDEYYLVDKRETGALKILEDDIITVYGEFKGIETITRALTSTKEELPRIDVKYVVLISE